MLADEYAPVIYHNPYFGFGDPHYQG